MDKTYNTNTDHASETSVSFPEVTRRYRPANPIRIWEYFGLLFSMLWDSLNGKYPLPKKTAIVMMFTFLYLISPVDIILDILPIIGFADDIALLFFAAGIIKEDVDHYRAWKISN